jgi:hypothetical protein
MPEVTVGQEDRTPNITVKQAIAVLMKDETVTLKQCVDFLWGLGYRMDIELVPRDDKEDVDA